MQRREFTAVGFSLVVPGSAWAAVNESDAAVGVRAALERGALAAVGLLGRNDGFLGNPQVREVFEDLDGNARRVVALHHAGGFGAHRWREAGVFQGASQVGFQSFAGQAARAFRRRRLGGPPAGGPLAAGAAGRRRGGVDGPTESTPEFTG